MKQDLLAGLKKISESLALFDKIDLSRLGEVYNDLIAAEQLARTDGLEQLAANLGKTADLTEKIVLEEAGEPETALQRLNEQINAMVELAAATETPSEPLAAPAASADSAAATNRRETETRYYRELHEAVDKDPDIAQDFALEAKDHLDNCTPALLELEKAPDNQDNINLVFRCFHTIKGVAGFLNLRAIQQVSHHAESLLDEVRSREREYDKTISNLMFEASDALRTMIGDLGKILEGQNPEHLTFDLDRLLARLDQLLSDKKNASPPVAVPSTAPSVPTPLPSPSPEPAVSVPAPTPATIPMPAPTPEPVSNAEKAAAPGPAGNNGNHRDGGTRKEVIKVDADRLTRLIDTIGELVIAETIVLQSEETRTHSNPSFLRKINQLDKITRELQNMGMALRMVAVRPTFQNMARLVRDLAEKQHKPINFVMRGEETEIDKNIVDKIGDPLVHMIRNAVDHGIEKSPEDRIAAGKAAAARVEIRAFHRAGNIYIEIEDDGRGIDPAVIFRKAVEKGLVSPDASLSKTEIINLIFLPGFSTADKITDISGRGVGMDVVRRNITELNGSVEINSEPGLGTVFSIRLPLTLAIIDGLVTRVAGECFVIPTLAVTRAVHICEQQIHRLEGRGEFILHQNRNFPIYRLDRFLGLPEEARRENRLMLIVDDGERGAGIVIDELIGKQQIVIKSLGNAFKQVEGYSGCAILSDGTVGLIIDINSVIKNYRVVCKEE